MIVALHCRTAQSSRSEQLAGSGVAVEIRGESGNRAAPSSGTAQIPGRRPSQCIRCPRSMDLTVSDRFGTGSFSGLSALQRKVTSTEVSDVGLQDVWVTEATLSRASRSVAPENSTVNLLVSDLDFASSSQAIWMPVILPIVS